MRRGLAVVAMAVVALFAVPAAGAVGHDVNIEGVSYSPDFVAITRGDTITWTNTEEVAIEHTVTADDGSFDSSPDCEEAGDPTCLQPGDDFTPDDITSIPVGDYSYFCKIHGKAVMSGLLSVNAPPTTTASTTTTTRPSTTTSSTTTSSTTTTTLPSSTTTSTLLPVTTEAASGGDDGGGGSGLTWLIVALIVVVLGGIIAVGTSMYRNNEAPQFDEPPRGPRPPPP